VRTRANWGEIDRLRPQHGRAAQKNADLVAALRQLLEQMAAKPVAPVSATRRILMRGAPSRVAKPWRTVETRKHSIGGITGKVFRFGAWSAQEANASTPLRQQVSNSLLCRCYF
jgi:hypothetical protein